MTTYQMHSKKLSVDYQFKFDDNGMILGFEILDGSVISLEKRRELIQYTPDNIEMLKTFCKKHSIELFEIKTDLSFEYFWKVYANTRGSKPEAIKLWDKMSDNTKNLAIRYIPKYNVQRGTEAQCHATKYLRQQYWVK